MKRFMERKLAERKAGPGGQVTVFILLAILFLCVADVSWANPKSKLKAISPKIWNFDTEKVGLSSAVQIAMALRESIPTGFQRSVLYII